VQSSSSSMRPFYSLLGVSREFWDFICNDEEVTVAFYSLLGVSQQPSPISGDIGRAPDFLLPFGSF